MNYFPIVDATDFIDFLNLINRNDEAWKEFVKGKIELIHIDKKGRINRIGKDPIEDDEKLAELVEKWLTEDEVGNGYWNNLLKKYFPKEVPSWKLLKKVDFSERMKELEKELLEGIEKLEIRKKKLFGIIPKTEISGYEEFFYKKLGKYGKKEIYEALKGLENKVGEKEREKIRAVIKVYEKKEGLNKKRRYGLILGAVLLAGIGSYGIYNLYKQLQGGGEQHPTQTTTSPPMNTTTSVPQEKPKPEIYSFQIPKNITTNSILPIYINASADKVLIEAEINGAKSNITASLLGDIFRANIPVKEGIYKIDKIYAFKGNKSIAKDVNAVLTAFDKPVINNVVYESKTRPGEEVLIKVNASDTSGIERAIMRVVTPDKKILKINGSKLNNGVYVFKFLPEKEPKYSFSIAISDPFNQTSYFNGTITSLDKPIINSLNIRKIPELGLLEVKVNASDTSGVEKAVLELNEANISMRRLSDKVFGYNISVGEDPTDIPLRVYVSDPYNQSASLSTLAHWLLSDAFTYFGVNHGIEKRKVQNFYSKYKDLVERFYQNQREDLAKTLHVYSINSTLLDKSRNLVYNDENITDKEKIFLELSNALFDLDRYNLRDVSLFYLGNLTAYEKTNPADIFDKQQILNVLNLTENQPIVFTGLSKDYTLKGIDTKILTYLVNENYNETKNYPYLLWALSKKGGLFVRLLNENSPILLPGAYGKKIKNFDITKKYDTNYSFIELLNMRKTQIINEYKNNLWLMGLFPSEILPKTNGSKLTSDLWMLQVSLPFSVMSGDSLKGNWIYHVYPELLQEYPEKAALLTFYDNIEAMNRFRKIFEDYRNGTLVWSTPYDDNSTIEKIVENSLTDWYKINAESSRDLKLLWDNGSMLAKYEIAIKSGAFSDLWLLEKYNITPIQIEEFRVSQKQIIGATIGVPMFGSDALIEDNAYDGRITFGLTENDYKLLKSIDNSSLVYDPTTRCLYPLITRENANYYKRLTGQVVEPFLLKWWISYPVLWNEKYNLPNDFFRHPERVLVWKYEETS